MKGSIPYVQQLEITDCGAACLSMVLGYFGKGVKLEEVRRITGTDRDGVDALALAKAARWYGLRARGVSLDLDGLKFLEPGAILHWEFNHFLVFERLTRRGVSVLDPAMGRRVISLEQFKKSFTGVALLLEPGERFEQERPSSKKRWRYLAPMLRRSGLLTRIVATSLLVQTFGLAVPILTGMLVDTVIPLSDRSLLVILFAGLGAMVAFHFFSSFLRAHLLLYLRTHLDLGLTFGFIDHLVELPYVFFLQRSSGDLMMRLNSNATVREILTSSALSTLLDGSFVSLYLILIFFESAPMGILILVLALIQVVVLALSRKKNQRLMAENLEAQAKSQSYLVQMLAGMETLKAAGAEHRGVEYWSNLFIREINASLSRGRLSALIDSVMSALRIGSPLMILAYGGLQVLEGHLSLGQMLAVSALAGGFLVPLATLVSTGLQVQLLGTYMERINDVLDTPSETVGQVAQAPKLTGEVALDRVTFHYGPLAPLVVDDVSLSVQRGQTVAIVGPSGSGKSTLVNLILGLYRPTSGRVLIDKIDLADLDPRSVRSQVGLVPQHPYLFGTSIRDNIALSDSSATLDSVMRAARQACIADDIEKMPMRYETLLADGGSTLSGGQRQRIAIARALLSEPAILVLDEATSSLDAETEARVYQNMQELECTRLVVAHRLSTIGHADLILVLDGGRIVEQGRHDELMATGGTYASLVVRQSGR